METVALNIESLKATSAVVDGDIDDVINVLLQLSVAGQDDIEMLVSRDKSGAWGVETDDPKNEAALALALKHFPDPEDDAQFDDVFNEFAVMTASEALDMLLGGTRVTFE